MIEVMNLTKRFGDIVAVDHIDATIRDGSVFGLTGTNGAGKSTFLRLASGVLKPDQGCIIIDGHEVSENIPAKKRFLYISDEQYLFDNTTPVEMMCYYSKVYQGFDEARLHKLMGNFGLGGKRKIHTFSRRMKRRVFVIYDVCVGVDYLSCDKAFDGLDPVMRQAVKSILIADMEDRNLIPVVASHNLRELKDIYDHVGLLHKGGTLLSKDLDDMKLNIHKIQCVLKPDTKPEDLTSLDRVNMEQRGSLCTITVQGSQSEVEAAMASYEPIFFKRIPLPLEEVLISETGVAGYDIRKLIF